MLLYDLRAATLHICCASLLLYVELTRSSALTWASLVQATVGLLVAKTLTNATANPFLAGGAGAYNPVLALDVFLVQVICLCCWTCNI